MRDRRFLTYAVLICLPAAALCLLGLYFLLFEVPRIQTRERSRATREYRRAAESLAANPSEAVYVGERRPGWRQLGKVVQGNRTLPWGHVPSGERRLVWVDDGAVTRAVSVPAEGLHEIGAWLTVGACVFLTLFVGITFCCLRFFILFARARNDFLAATAHDLTTPLVGMRYLIGRCDEDVRNLNERLLLLVGNIKDFLSLGGRRARPVCERFPIGDAFDEAYRIFAADYEEEKSGPVEVFGDPSLAVSADRTMTVQILWNLLGNDLKYAAPFGPVRVRFAAQERWLRADFIDEGQGMTPRQMRRAFDRYYRARTVLDSGKGGFGIGLCTAREFARAMGGGLSVAANSPAGCVFTLLLPLASDYPERNSGV